MTIDEIAGTLPNGFHDATLSTLTINYALGEMTMKVDVWIGDIDADADTYRLATLTLSGLIFCVIEPPATPLAEHQKRGLDIDSGTVESLTKPTSTRLPTETIEGAFTNWFYVREWNAFLYVSATDARLVWEGEPRDRE